VTGVTKFIYAIVAFILIVAGAYIAMQGDGNCWSNYQTEDAAIMACEVHE
jgi:hypothetical protein